MNVDTIAARQVVEWAIETNDAAERRKRVGVPARVYASAIVTPRAAPQGLVCLITHAAGSLNSNDARGSIEVEQVVYELFALEDRRRTECRRRIECVPGGGHMRILTVSQVANFMDVKTQFSRCKLELAPFDVAQGTPSEVEGRNRMNCSPSTRTPPSVDAMALS